MNIIPIVSQPAQQLGTILSEQVTTLRVYQKFFGLYIDVLVNDALIIGGVVARDRNRIVRSAYLGFTGDLAFFDTQGSKDPSYEDLGNRWLLAYFADDAELSQFGIT